MDKSSFSVEIIDIALPNNYGVARRDNFVIFVPDAIIGDKVEVKISREEKRFAYGEIVNIEEPSSFRTHAKCPHFGFCGGCTLQSLIYEKQLEVKENHLLQILRRIGSLNVEKVEITPIAPSPDRYFYRSKLELAFGRKDGYTIIGLRERVSPFKKFTGQVVPLEKCLIFSPVVEKIIPLFSDISTKYNLTPYDPLTRKGFMRHLILKESKTTGKVMALLETTNGKLPDTEGLWQKLVEQIPEVKSLYRVINNRHIDIENYEKQYHLFGEPYIEELISGFTFRIYPQSFFQPNSKGAEVLYNKIVQLSQLKGNEKILGLYCGTGPIEMFLSRAAGKVTGIDSNPTNIMNAIENCQLNGIKNCSFYRGKVEKVPKDTFIDKPDLLVIDPPRGGMSNQGLKLILDLYPKKIAYVSCNPSTLARDMKYLQEHNYTVTKIASFDFFPHTTHLEVLVIFEKTDLLFT